MYYIIQTIITYILIASNDLPEKEDVDGVKLWQIGFALLGEEIVDLSLTLAFLHEIVNVHLRKLWFILVLMDHLLRVD
jgi:hypothetical protein